MRIVSRWLNRIGYKNSLVHWDLNPNQCHACSNSWASRQSTFHIFYRTVHWLNLSSHVTTISHNHLHSLVILRMIAMNLRAIHEMQGILTRRLDMKPYQTGSFYNISTTALFLKKLEFASECYQYSLYLDLGCVVLVTPAISSILAVSQYCACSIKRSDWFPYSRLENPLPLSHVLLDLDYW